MPPLKRANKLFYGWMVLVALLIIGTTLFGIRLTFGVFFKSIESDFGLSRAVTSSILSATLLISGLIAFLGGWALDRFGPRKVASIMAVFTCLSLLLTGLTGSAWQLFFSYSFLLSLGTGAMYVLVMSTASRWFDKKRGMALGIASSGNGLGTLVVSFAAAFLIARFDWRTAYMVIGVCALVIVLPVAQILKSNPYAIGLLPDGTASTGESKKLKVPGLTVPQVLRTRSFWLIVPGWVLFASTWYLVLTHIVPHLTDTGFSPVQAASVLSLIGAANIAGRVVLGAVSDKMGRKKVAFVFTVLQACVFLWLLNAGEMWMFYLFALVYGFSFGGSEVVLGALISDTFGVGNIGAIFGAFEIVWGIGSAIGPLIGGLSFDMTQSYATAFIYCSLAMLAVTLLVTLVRKEIKP